MRKKRRFWGVFACAEISFFDFGALSQVPEGYENKAGYLPILPIVLPTLISNQKNFIDFCKGEIRSRAKVAATYENPFRHPAMHINWKIRS